MQIAGQMRGSCEETAFLIYKREERGRHMFMLRNRSSNTDLCKCERRQKENLLYSAKQI